MSAKEQFSQRLRAAMAAAGLEISGTALEGAFNRKWTGAPIRVQTVWNWINAKAIPRQDKLQVLAKLLRVDPHALQYGPSDPPSVAERRRSWDERVTYAERETLEAFLGLPTPQRLMVREVIVAFAKAYGKVDPVEE